MNLQDEKYQNYALCREMLETPTVISAFDPKNTQHVSKFKYMNYDSVLLTGEGSSRIFPGKNAITSALRSRANVLPFTEGATQAMDYDLSKTLVIGASNSGKTRELICLFKQLKELGHKALIGITAHNNTPLTELSNEAFVLACGGEDAVAATKSVVEQALFVSSILAQLQDKEVSEMDSLAEKAQKALNMNVPQELVSKASKAPTLYYSGRNDGVAEELTLKTNEITRKKSDFLEGTYCVHGIEEVMVKKTC